MDGNPLVSIMMPVYNREKYLREAIQSIRNQTYQNWRLLIYDDGSTDGTPDVIKEYMQVDERIAHVYCYGLRENRGVAFARNMLLKACETEIACYHDSDDWSHPLRLDIQVRAFEPDMLLFTSWQWLTFMNSEEDWFNLHPQTSRAYATVMFCPDKEIRYDENKILGAEDCDWLERMKQAGRREFILPNLLYSIRSHEDRIGRWKRKIYSMFKPHEIQGLSYAQAIKKYTDAGGK